MNIKQASSECCNFFQYCVNSEYVVIVFITACIRGNSCVPVRAGVSGLHECKEFLTEPILLFFCLLLFLCLLLALPFACLLC